MTTSEFLEVRLADDHGSVLAGRDLAKHIRREVVDQVEHGEEAVIDLDGVVAISPSFADELFGKLPAAVGEKVRFENVSEHLAAVARMARAGRGPDRP